MKFLFLLSTLFLSANCFCQPNYKATVFSTDISNVNYYWSRNAVIKENVLLFNAQDANQNVALYAYNLGSNTLSTGKEAAPWHNDLPLENIYEVNGTRVMFSSKDLGLYKFTKDSLSYASLYFSPDNPLGYHIQVLSSEDMIVYKDKLYFQGFIVPNDALNPCAGEAALMTWDGVNAPTTAPLVYSGHSSCYKSGNDNNPGNRFSIKNFSIFHDTLFYSGGKYYDGTDFYYLDKNDSSIVAIPKGSDPSDVDYVMQTYVVGEYMYFWAIQKNGMGGFFKYKGLNQLPEKVNIVTKDTPSSSDAIFYGDKLFMRAYINSVAYPYLIYPDGTITVANNLENFYNTLTNDTYVLSYESGISNEWNYIPTSDLTAAPLPATELNNLSYYTTTNNGSSPNGITIKGSGLSYLGKDGDWMLFRQTTYHRMCKNISETGPCDTLLYKNNIVTWGPADKSPIKPKDPFFETCHVNYGMDVKHIADCSANDFPGDSRSTGEIKLTLTGNQSAYEVTWYRSDDKENWSALNTTTFIGAHIYGGLTKGFYKASIKTNSGCVLQTAYYEVKSLIGVNKKTYKEFQSYYRLDSYGNLPVNITFITPKDTTKTAIGFEFIDKYRIPIAYLEGENFLIHTDLSGCRNVDTFTVGITQKSIKSEFLCDSTRFYFDVARGVPPFKVTITEQSNTTDTLINETYNTFFHFDKKVHPRKMGALILVVEDATGNKNETTTFHSIPTITFSNVSPPNCSGKFKSDGQIIARVEQLTTLTGNPYIYSWKDDASIKISVPVSDPTYSFFASRNISAYGEYTFQVKDTVYGCLYKNTVSITDPYKNYQTDLDNIYEICAGKPIQIHSAERLWFSSDRNMITNNGVGNTFYFYDSREIIDTTIYYVPFNTTTGCFASTLDSFTIKNFSKVPIESDTLICTIGETISFMATHQHTDWYVDSYHSAAPPVFTGKIFDFKTTTQTHTIYAAICNAVFDSVKIQYRTLDPLKIMSDVAADSIVTCMPITLHTKNQDADATVHWIAALDTVSETSSYSIPVPYTASIYAIQQIENCTSAASNRIYIDRYVIPTPALYASGDSLYTNTVDSVSWYLNGQYITHSKNSFTPVLNGYYHIVKKDKNGCTAESNDVYVEIKKPLTFCNCVYPIPTHAGITFDYAELESVAIYTAVGAELGSYKTNMIDLSAFANAMYIAKIKLKDGSIYIEKIIKY